MRQPASGKRERRVRAGVFELLQSHLAVGPRPLSCALDVIEALHRRCAELSEQPQTVLFGAKLKQLLLCLWDELDRRGHRVGVKLLEDRFRRARVGRPCDNLGVAAACVREHVLVDICRRVGEELDRAGGIGHVVDPAQELERSRALDDDVHSAVLSALEQLRDDRRAANFPEAVIGKPDDTELGLIVEAIVDHPPVALLEDVQWQQLMREKDDAERKERKAFEAVGHDA